MLLQYLSAILAPVSLPNPLECKFFGGSGIICQTVLGSQTLPTLLEVIIDSMRHFTG